MSPKRLNYWASLVLYFNLPFYLLLLWFLYPVGPTEGNLQADRQAIEALVAMCWFSGNWKISKLAK
jgi:hypothetical protein